MWHVAPILRLVDMPKTSWRLDEETLRLLTLLAQSLGATKTHALQAAVRHTYATIRRGDPIYVAPPPEGDAAPRSA